MASTRDDALLWLNDRLGKSVHVDVIHEKGDLPVAVLSVRGTLRYWREREGAQRQAGEAREDLIGLYAVGDAHLDLSDLEHLSFVERPEVETLRVELGEDAFLEIVEMEDFDAG